MDDPPPRRSGRARRLSQRARESSLASRFSRILMPDDRFNPLYDLLDAIEWLEAHSLQSSSSESSSDEFFSQHLLPEGVHPGVPICLDDYEEIMEGFIQ